MRSHTLRTLLLAALLSSCTVTRVVDSWKDPTYAGPPLKHLLVCGLHADETFRHILEDQFVRDLHARGVAAEACYQHLPPGKPTEEQLHAAVQELGVDGTVVTYYMGARTYTEYVPSAVGTFPGYYWGAFYPSFGPTWDVVYGPGYLQTDVQVVMVTKVYLAQDSGKLIWSGTSESLNPSSAQKMIGSVVPKLLTSIEHAGIVPAPAKVSVTSPESP